MPIRHPDLEQFDIKPYRSKRLEPYFKHFSQDDDTVLYDDNVADVLLAQGFNCDSAPRSVYTVQKLYEALAEYAPSKNHYVVDDDDLRAGLNLAYSCFSPKDGEKLEILEFTPRSIVAVTSNPSGSPGVTNYGCSKAQSIFRALERGLQTIKGIKQPEPCLAFKRTQFNGKTRLVWGYPYSMTAIEGMVAKPLIERFKGGCTPMAFAMTTGALGTKLRVASYHKELAYSLDMSQFDATIPAFLIRSAFKILKQWFREGSIEPVSGVTVDRYFDLIENYFIYTPIIMPDGRIYKGKNHGVPSGSYFTQMIDSIVNVIICGAISHHFCLNVDKRELFVLGDDILFWCNRKVDLDVISKYANAKFGVRLHGKEKSEIFLFNQPIHFLGRYWTNGLPDIDQEEILKRMFYPEQYRKYPKAADKRRRQIKMLLLSYASVYRSAWQIASQAIKGNTTWDHNGSAGVDVPVYCYDNVGGEEFDPSFMSGYDRYRMKYGLFHHPDSDIPVTAMQYWL